MAISLKDLKSTTAVLPPRILIYGPPGMGKTTFAAEFANPVFLQTEDGTPGGLEIVSFGHLTSFDMVMESMMSLAGEDHDFATLIVDSLDKLEAVIHQKACADNNWKTLEDPGFGKGYVVVDRYWREFFDGLTHLRRDRNMTVILIAHSTIDRFDSPTTAPYSRYDIRVHKRALAMVQDEVDAIFLLNQEAAIKSDDVGFNRKAIHAEGGGTRWLYTEGRPAFTAKNRYGLPDKMIYTKGKGYATLAPYLPGQPAISDAA